MRIHHALDIQWKGSRLSRRMTVAALADEAIRSSGEDDFAEERTRLLPLAAQSVGQGDAVSSRRRVIVVGAVARQLDDVEIKLVGQVLAPHRHIPGPAFGT